MEKKKQGTKDGPKMGDTTRARAPYTEGIPDPSPSDRLALDCLLGLDVVGLLWEELRLDGGEDAALGDDDVAEQPVELLVVPHSELEVSRDDARLLVVSSSVPSELEDLGRLDEGAREGGRRAVSVSHLRVTSEGRPAPVRMGVSRRTRYSSTAAR